MWKELSLRAKIELVVWYIIILAGFIFCTIAMIKDFKAGDISDGFLMLGILLYVCWAIFGGLE